VLYAIGSINAAIADFKVADNLKCGDESVVLNLGMCYFALGKFASACRYFQQVLTINEDSIAWYYIQVLKFYSSNLNKSAFQFSADQDINPKIKEGLCKKLLWRTFVTSIEHRSSETFSLDSCSTISDLQPLEFEVRSYLTMLLRRSMTFSHWIQLDTPGFVRNERQHRQFGLAVCQMIDALKSARLEPGYQVRDSFSSKKNLDLSFTCRIEFHKFSWRDFFDIAVRWRQLSEPNDPVWWIDGMTLESFCDGFGLQTPMVSGQLKCIRYHSYFEKVPNEIKIK